MNPNNKLEYKILIDLYRCLQILLKHVNSTHLTKILLPGHLVPIFFVFIIGFNAIVHNTAPHVLTALFACFCIFVCVHYIYTLALFWRLTTNSEELLLAAVKEKVKFVGQSSYDQKYLRTFLPLVARIGIFGGFDKNFYYLNANITIDFTINTLMM